MLQISFCCFSCGIATNQSLPKVILLGNNSSKRITMIRMLLLAMILLEWANFVIVGESTLI